MKKKIKLTAFNVESFVTGADKSLDTKQYVGGGLTDYEPGSGPCLECIVTDLNYSLECCYETEGGGCGTIFACQPTSAMVCDTTEVACHTGTGCMTEHPCG